MTPEALLDGLRGALTDRQLLQHPFYVRWEAGALQPGELAAYAEQYRHFEAALPGLLRDLLGDLEPGPAADLVRHNLADEESNPEPHVQVFARFAQAAGAGDALAREATASLVDTYHELSASSPAEGLAALVAYEMQAPAIAGSKAGGLRRHYGFDARGTEFWDLHATMDADHTRWGAEALLALGAPADQVIPAARSAADAWWAFLDDREAQAAPSAAAG